MSSNTFTLGTKSVNRLGYGAMQLAGPRGFWSPKRSPRRYNRAARGAGIGRQSH